MLKYSEESLQIQQEVKDRVENDSGEKKRKERKSESSKKRLKDSPFIETETPKSAEIKLAIPEVLKLKLVDEWENVTKNGKVIASFI